MDHFGLYADKHPHTKKINHIPILGWYVHTCSGFSKYEISLEVLLACMMGVLGVELKIWAFMQSGDGFKQFVYLFPANQIAGFFHEQCRQEVIVDFLCM